MLALPMAPALKLCASLETKAAQLLTAWNGVCRCLAPVWGLPQQLKSCPVKNQTISGGKKMCACKFREEVEGSCGRDMTIIADKTG